MTDPNRVAEAAPAALTLTDTADARTVARFRRELSRWLRGRFALDPVRLNDVLLAVNEALTNAAEFAYRGLRGTVTMQARYVAADRALVFEVSDRGAWRHTDPKSRSNTRGRGIPLMRALADSATIYRLPGGTRVRLQFDGCAPMGSKPLAASV
jgi:anti-sigma regulatory factor (Ser/Thr protein kinase)